MTAVEILTRIVAARQRLYERARDLPPYDEPSDDLDQREIDLCIAQLDLLREREKEASGE